MRRSDLAGVILMFITSGTLSVRTLAPSLSFGDSAEFQTIAYTLGMGHPTGYSVYVLLAKLFTILPVGEVAYRVNLFSAFCAALGVVLVYLILRTLGAWSIPAICGALALAVTPLFWKHASIAEIYTPLAACLAFILLAVFQWRKTNHPRWLFAAGLAGGLSLGIHTTVAFIAAPVVLYLVLCEAKRADWSQAVSGAAVGLAFFTLSFLVLDSINSPAGYYNSVVRPSLSTWGMTPADFDSPFERFWFLYFPPQFRDQFFGTSAEEVRARFTEFTAEGGMRLSIAALGFLSLWFLPREDKSSHWREAILLVLTFILLFVFAVTYNVPDYQAFYIPGILLLVIFMGLGLNLLVELAALVFRAKPFVARGVALLLLLLWVYPLTGTVTAQWQKRIPPGLEDWERNLFEFPETRKLRAEQIVNALGDRAILFTVWDRMYGFYYVAHVLQGRTQMDFHEAFPQEGITQLADSAVEYIEANIDTRPIYFEDRPTQLADRYKIQRTGSGLFRIERK